MSSFKGHGSHVPTTVVQGGWEGKFYLPLLSAQGTQMLLLLLPFLCRQTRGQGKEKGEGERRRGRESPHSSFIAWAPHIPIHATGCWTTPAGENLPKKGRAPFHVFPTSPVHCWEQDCSYGQLGTALGCPCQGKDSWEDSATPSYLVPGAGAMFTPS